MPKLHVLKLREFFCDPVYNGEKKFEVRENDRGFQRGDFVRFLPVNALGANVKHPIEDVVYKITYVLSGWGIENGHVVFGIEPDNVYSELI